MTFGDFVMADHGVKLNIFLSVRC